MSVRSTVGVMIMAVVAAGVAAADEWNRFRGPNGQGQSDAGSTIPTSWTDKDYNWKISLPGVGHSSPVVWGNKVFVTSADPDTAERHVLCVNTANGEKLWQRDFSGKPYHLHTQNSYATSTPALDAERVYLAWASADEYTLQALTHDGNDVWRINLGPFKSEHGFGTSPIVVDDMVIITNDQEGENRFLIAVDAKTGDVRWKVPRKYADNRQNASYATPCVRDTSNGRELIVCSWAHGITAHDLKTGAVNWEAPVFKLRPVGSPVLADGLILANTGEGSEGKGNNSVYAVRPAARRARTRNCFTACRNHRRHTSRRFAPPATWASCGAITASSLASIFPPASNIGGTASAAFFIVRPSASEIGFLARRPRVKSMCWPPRPIIDCWPAIRWAKEPAPRQRCPMA